MPKIAIRQADDWIAVYLDGKSAYQGHSITGRDMLELLKIEHTYEYSDESPENLATEDFFPEVLND